MITLTDEQIQTYRADGFLVIEDFITSDEVETLRRRLDLVFDGQLDLVVEPDEYKWQKGRDPEDVQRVLGGIWRSDPIIAEFTFSENHARLAGQLEAVDSVRLWTDAVWWKPEGGKPFNMHQDAAFMSWVDPIHEFSCWIALDDVYENSGTLSYARGSHRWGPQPKGGGDPSALRRGSTELWRDSIGKEYLQQFAPEGVDVEIVPLEVKAGSAAFHTGWIWHGSGPNTRIGTIRRSYSIHMIPASSRHHPIIRHPASSRYFRPGQLEFDESFFPILWSEDGYRTPWLREYTGLRPVSAWSQDALELVGREGINVEPWVNGS